MAAVFASCFRCDVCATKQYRVVDVLRFRQF